MEISDIGDMLSKNGFIEGGWERWLCCKFEKSIKVGNVKEILKGKTLSKIGSLKVNGILSQISCFRILNVR